MNQLLKKVKDIHQKGCVSIILQTHRTSPDNEKDPINLKNLIGEAEKRLYQDYDKRFVWPIMEKLNRLTETIDHRHNLESLILFANSDFADYTRLPISVENRVVIDHTFATRDLVRALHQSSAYYLLVLSRQQARLIEAHDDRVVKEWKGDFPMESRQYTTNRLKLSMQKGQDNLIEEFFNRVDKTMLEATKSAPLPLVLVTEKRNYDHYLKVADQKARIMGHVNRNRDEESAHHIVRDAWKVVLDLVKRRREARLEELRQAVGERKFVSDYNEIWTALRQGQGKTLFVKKGFFQPALLVDDKITLVDAAESSRKGVVDDIIDEMIEENLRFGGDAVFIEDSEIEKFGNVALVTRY